jgi:ribonuclease HII
LFTAPPLLNDSKQMTEKAREQLRFVIKADEIDRLNILWASVTGMQRPAFVLSGISCYITLIYLI